MIGTHASFKGTLKAGDVVRVGVDQKRETVLAVYDDSFRTTHPTHLWQTWTWEYNEALLELLPPLPPPGDAIGPACEEEHLLGYDVGKEGGDETVALYGKRHEDGSVEITKTVRGLPLETPYEPRVGDRVSVECVVKEVNTGAEFCTVVIENSPLIFNTSSLSLVSRKTRTLTKAEAEALLTGKLGESVRIE